MRCVNVARRVELAPRIHGARLGVEHAVYKFGEGQATHGFIVSYAMVQILADAISRAGSTEPDAINKALGETRDLPTVLAKITVGSDHRGVIPVSALQWQGDKQVTVWPPNQATGTFEAPAPGLAG